MDEMCLEKERSESKMTPKFLAWEEGKICVLAMVREGRDTLARC